jgi:hypothetical protein
MSAMPIQRWMPPLAMPYPFQNCQKIGFLDQRKPYAIEFSANDTRIVLVLILLPPRNHHWPMNICNRESLHITPREKEELAQLKALLFWLQRPQTMTISQCHYQQDMAEMTTMRKKNPCMMKVRAIQSNFNSEVDVISDYKMPTSSQEPEVADIISLQPPDRFTANTT